jgi:hypothetical protein
MICDKYNMTIIICLVKLKNQRESQFTDLIGKKKSMKRLDISEKSSFAIKTTSSTSAWKKMA